MARVTDNGISGTIGGMVFYTMNGKRYVRARPGKRKKKRNAVPTDRNHIFGLVSTCGSAMLKKCSTSFAHPLKLVAYNNLRGWMRNLYGVHGKADKWECSIQESGMCQLNAAVDLRDCWKANFTITDQGKGNLSIDIPEFTPTKAVLVPSRTMKVNMKLIAVVSSFTGKNDDCLINSTTFSFNYSSMPVPAQQFVLQTHAGTGSIAIVFMALEFFTENENKSTLVNQPKWLPAAAVMMGRLM